MDLGGEDLTQRTAEDPEVMGEHEHHAVVDAAPAGDHTVGGRALLGQSEGHGAMAGEEVELDEGPLVEQQLEPLTGRQLAAIVLALGRHLTRASDGRRPGRLQPIDVVVHRRHAAPVPTERRGAPLRQLGDGGDALVAPGGVVLAHPRRARLGHVRQRHLRLLVGVMTV